MAERADSRMTEERFYDYLHGIGCSASRFREMLAMWRQTPEGSRDVRIEGNVWDFDRETLESTVIIRTREGYSEKKYYNPIEAWTIFWQAVDVIVRRKLRKLLKAQGRNEFTGALNSPTPSPPPEVVSSGRQPTHCFNCQLGIDGRDICPVRHEKDKCAVGIPINEEWEAELRR